jgi:hypothetical protein
MADLSLKSVDDILDDDESNTPQHAALKEMKAEARRLEDEKLSDEALLKYEELLVRQQMCLGNIILRRTRRCNPS